MDFSYFRQYLFRFQFNCLFLVFGHIQVFVLLAHLVNNGYAMAHFTTLAQEEAVGIVTIK